MIPLRDINPTATSPIVTLGLIAASVIVFFAVQPQTEPESEDFAYENAAIACEVVTGDPLDSFEVEQEVCEDQPAGSTIFPDKNVYAAVLYSMFLHGSIAHLLGNMWFLWVFGNNVEEAFGRIGYVLFYLGTGLVATLGFVLNNQDSTVPLVGASGAIAGVMGAYLVLFPLHKVMTLVFFVVTAIPAVAFLGLWFFTQFALVGQESGIAWEAHVFGFLAGVLVALPLRVLLLRRTASVRLGPFEGAR
ncbi:MAG: rhomboid family intramembrane serine protease [Acidimicrobiia bacterium]